MANKRIKDLETLDGASLDGVNDYLVVDDVSGNTSKMAVDTLIKNSGPFTDVASLGPPTVHVGNMTSAKGANYISTDVFAYGNACWGMIHGGHKKSNFVLHFCKGPNTSVMNSLAGDSVISKTINPVGTNFRMKSGISTEGVANNTGGSYWDNGQQQTLAHRHDKYFAVQFGTGGLSVWGAFTGKGSSGHWAKPHQAFAGDAGFMFMVWEGV